ncbi:hypothetical protein EPUS_09228 [Endocarpon pusillum Z07020]|uniref:Uncharacterized protein n=1 Tax=Endocarpon pusillum (strain Z07020 / HMAS-L-300199) TaxID=1263415 RepID=U1G9I4_ENDPU|nr:uncharacterized protein EPUS_09228 [Endocarpon pusillum Z07020]ERF74132.1 hypothetical protein EPUS_09228 [Endocarpon pusillum Z07020]
MPDPAQRRAQARSRLQNQLRQRKTKDGKPPTLEQLEQMCEEDVKRLVAHINFVTEIGISDMTAPLWTHLLCWLEEGVQRIEVAGGPYKRADFQHASRLHSSQADKWQHIEEAKCVLANLHVLVPQLPPGHRLLNPGRLGLRPTSEVTQYEVAHANDPDDPVGTRGFQSAVRDFERLGIPLPPQIALFILSIDAPLQSRDCEKALDVMERSLIGFKVDQQQSATTFGQEKATKATVKRLEKWIDQTKSRFASRKKPDNPGSTSRRRRDGEIST